MTKIHQEKRSENPRKQKFRLQTKSVTITEYWRKRVKLCMCRCRACVLAPCATCPRPRSPPAVADRRRGARTGRARQRPTTCRPAAAERPSRATWPERGKRKGKVRGKSNERGTRAFTIDERNAQINAKDPVTIRVQIRNTNKNITHAKTTKNTQSSHGSNK
jgi:hypothetical protein